MQAIARLRMPSALHDELQTRAKAERTSVSAKIRGALKPYVKGDKALPVGIRNDKETTFTCNTGELVEFKKLAEAAGLPFDEAVRIAVLNSMQVSQPE